MRRGVHGIFAGIGRWCCCYCCCHIITIWHAFKHAPWFLTNSALSGMNEWNSWSWFPHSSGRIQDSPPWHLFSPYFSKEKFESLIVLLPSFEVWDCIQQYNGNTMAKLPCNSFVIGLVQHCVVLPVDFYCKPIVWVYEMLIWGKISR